MKSTTAIARVMTAEERQRRIVELKREIPAAQSLLDALKRVDRAEKRKAKKQGE